MTIKYRSTRGKQNGLRFEEVILGGLATDRGLYVPESIPTFTIDEIEKVIYLGMQREWVLEVAN
jgi:threonine synthase